MKLPRSLPWLGGVAVAALAACADTADTGGVDANPALCAEPGVVTTATPATVPGATSDYNVTLLDCTRTAATLACELGIEHAYAESIDGASRHITANGVPDHDVGDFPNDGNPNAISAQTYAYDVPVTPAGDGAVSAVHGIALSGVVFDPGTAETWNNNPTWRYEALRYETAGDYADSDDTNHPTALGLDCNFAHVQPTGAYHYHGIPTGMVPATPVVTHVGWAADGYPIFARWGPGDPADATSPVRELRSSFALKAGERPAGSPGGTYDGTFGNDWEYVAGSGNLDECNGRTGTVTIAGATSTTYYYVLTNTFPYIPRCTPATPNPSFQRDDGGGDPGGDPPMCAEGQTAMCCGDGACDGPETADNCAADC